MKLGRLLFLTERFDPEPFLAGELAQFFVDSGFKVTVLTQVPSYPDDRIYPGFTNSASTVDDPLGFRVVRVKTTLGYKRSLVLKIWHYFNFMVRASLRLLMLNRHFDAVFVYHTGPLTQALPLLLVKGARGKRVLWTQDVWPDTVYEYGLPMRRFYQPLLEQFVKRIYRSCDRIAVSSPGFISSVRAQCRTSQKVSCVPQWVPERILQGYQEGLKPQAGSKIFRFAGTIGTMQNLEPVIAGFSLAAQQNTQIVLEIIGDGSERQRLQDFVETQGIPRVFFPGRVPMDQVMSLQQTAFALVLSLIDSGTVAKTIPAKFQSYLAAGRPILGVASGTVAELIQTAKVGMCADPSESMVIAKAFLALSEISENDASAMGENARSFLDQNYQKELVCAQFLKLLEP